MEPYDHRRDEELISLALETRLAADSIADRAIHDRLMEIADELLDRASFKENSGQQSREYDWPA